MLNVHSMFHKSMRRVADKDGPLETDPHAPRPAERPPSRSDSPRRGQPLSRWPGEDARHCCSSGARANLPGRHDEI
jgi:hypothetical protein